MTGVEVSFAQDPQPMAPVMCCGAEPCVRGGIQAENVATLRLTDVTPVSYTHLRAEKALFL